MSHFARPMIAEEKRSPVAEKIQKAVVDAGGTIVFSSDDPSIVIAIDLYNGNNPLKGRGGKNDVVNDAWLKHLEGLTSLTKLSLSNCAVTDEGMKQVGRLTGLEELNLTLTPVTDQGLSHLSDLTQMRNLGLASTQCTGSGFAQLKGMSRLENVNFHYTPFNDEGLKAVCGVGVSVRLWFAHTHFTDAAAQHLSQLKDLQRCGIGSKHQESSGAAVAALADLPLIDLSLLDNQATNEGIRHAAKIKTLRTLDVSYGPTVTDEVLAELAAMPALESLTLGGSKHLTEQGVLALGQSKSLKELRLRGMKQFTETSLKQLRLKRPGLKIEFK